MKVYKGLVVDDSAENVSAHNYRNRSYIDADHLIITNYKGLPLNQSIYQEANNPFILLISLTANSIFGSFTIKELSGILPQYSN